MLRLTEEMPDTITPEMTEHTIHRDECTKCKKTVEPVVLSALLHDVTDVTMRPS